MASEREAVRTAYYVMTDYVRKGQAKSRNRVFIVHRLDRETSGVLIFAKDEEAKRRMQENWENTEKRYLAVVHGRTPADEGTITSYLAESETFRVYSTPDATKGKFSQTEYRVLKRTPAFSFLELSLTTGRKNQIRVHCADGGFPIAGDKKYGKEKDVHQRLALHAYRVRFEHPVTRRAITCVAPVPVYFKNLLGPIDDMLDAQEQAFDPQT